MNGRQWKRESGIVGAALPGFRPMTLGFVEESEWVAACFQAVSSGFSPGSFYVEAFALPRFVPTEVLYFNYGFRVGRRWDAIDRTLADAMRDAVPQLRSLATLAGLRARTERWEIDVYHAEVRIALAILETRERELEAVTRALASMSLTRGWEAPIRERALDLAAYARAEGFDAATDRLRDRRDQVGELLT